MKLTENGKMKTRKKIEAGTTLCSLLSTFAAFNNRFFECPLPKIRVTLPLFPQCFFNQTPYNCWIL